jgi:hypothetical protein
MTQLLLRNLLYLAVGTDVSWVLHAWTHVEAVHFLSH